MCTCITITEQSTVRRCGADLKTLFSSPLRLHFLNCTPMRDAQSEKIIYQPRKVSDKVTVFKHVLNTYKIS